MNKAIHFRRCHVCGTVTTRQGAKVEKCQSCKKSLAPFFYFDDRFTAVQGDTALRPPLVEGQVLPVHGLTVHWDSF